MACRGRCFSTPDGSHGRPVDHQQDSQLGLTWYFCPAHKTFHAFFLLGGSPQPLCGECAVLFYDRTHYAVWIRPYDLLAVMSNAGQVFRHARADMDALLAEHREARQAGLSIPSDPLAPPEALCSDILSEIPKHDPTYASLGAALIPHARLSGMFLLEYCTFQGVRAYQPCSKDMDLSRIFDALRPIDQDCDPVFAQARTWCCIVQAAEALPKELRWVLATMYNFCNEMLCPDLDEDTLWNMRPWLLHWYTVAEGLLDAFGIFASTPDIDWFARPKPTLVRAPSHTHASHVSRSDTAPSSLCETVIRHKLDFGGDGSDEDHVPSHHGRLSLIQAWLASQPLLGDMEKPDMFDPTPGGFVSPKTRRSASPDCGTPPTRLSRLNPCAAVWRPHSPGLLDRDSAEESDESDGAAEDSGSDTDGCRCSCRVSAVYNSPTRTGCEHRAPPIHCPW